MYQAVFCPRSTCSTQSNNPMMIRRRKKRFRGRSASIYWHLMNVYKRLCKAASTCLISLLEKWTRSKHYDFIYMSSKLSSFVLLKVNRYEFESQLLCKTDSVFLERPVLQMPCGCEKQVALHAAYALVHAMRREIRHVIIININDVAWICFKFLSSASGDEFMYCIWSIHTMEFPNKFLICLYRVQRSFIVVEGGLHPRMTSLNQSFVLSTSVNYCSG